MKEGSFVKQRQLWKLGDVLQFSARESYISLSCWDNVRPGSSRFLRITFLISERHVFSIDSMRRLHKPHQSQGNVDKARVILKRKQCKPTSQTLTFCLQTADISVELR